MALINPPQNSPVDELGKDAEGKPTLAAVSQGWRNFFVAVFNILTALTLNGTTANRPIKFLWIGRPYFDVTLGIPIWVRSLSPTVWVNGAGAVV